MKTLIKKWLGIDVVEYKLKQNEQDMKRQVGIALNDAIKGESDQPITAYMELHKHDENMLHSTLRRYVSRYVTVEQAKQFVSIDLIVKDVIAKEAFIDEIIERIKRKQLK